LKQGLAADVVVFDPENIADRSTYEKGSVPAVGMEYVVVNGELVLDAGVRTEFRPGRGLRHGF
jgi:N-acyl-D-aspartate/D-glutamate deacylase